MAKPSKKTPVISPTQERSRFTFEAILKATTYLIEQKGVFNFTSNDIAEKAGVNINSFYQYFLNKEAAVGEVVNRFLRQDEKLFAELVLRCKSFEEVLAGSAEIMSLDRKLRKEILVNIQALIGADKVYKRRRDFAQLLEPLLPSKRFRTKEERFLGAQVVVHTFLSVVVGFMDGSSEKLEKEAIQKEITGLILNYVR